MQQEVTTIEVTGTKKNIMYGVVGASIILVVTGVFIPEARVFITTTCKTLLELVPMLVK